VRVGIDYTAAVNQSDGIGRFVRNLVHTVTSIDHDNEYVLVHAVPNEGRPLAAPEAPNVHTQELRFRERIMNVLWQRLQIPMPAEFATGPIDIFHAPNFVLPPLRKATSILTVHDLAFLIHPECADERLAAYLGRVVPRSALRADFIVTDSESTRNDVICLLDVNADRVFVVPGGVSSAFTPADDQRVTAVRSTYDLPLPYILAVGVIEPRKNLPRLIDAFTRFKVRTGAPHELVIAGGRGWLSEETYRRAAQSTFEPDIRFTGYVPDDDLRALYTGAEVFVYPSLYEGFGLPVLEAMACGAPVICSNTSSLPEVASGAAELVGPEDPDEIATALETVTSNGELRSSLRARGTARAAEYTWERAARQLLDVYAHAAGDRPAGPPPGSST
jgi:glycosyltransferase involved in cell wall biosynthesis